MNHTTNQKRGGRLASISICLMLLLSLFACPATVYAAPTDQVYNATADVSYETLAEAIAAAQAGDVIEVHGDTTETAVITIAQDVTVIAGAGKSPTVNAVDAKPLFSIQSGAKVTFGNGNASDSVHFVSDHSLVSCSGEMTLQDGATFTSGAKNGTMRVSGTGSKFSGLGGSITCTGNPGESISGVAIYLENNATASFSGGTYTGEGAAVEAMTGTIVTEISGGSFVALNSTKVKSNSSRGAFYVFQNARIETISGGTFTGHNNGDGLTVMSGGSIGTISGGRFEALPNKNMEKYAYYHATGLWVNFDAATLAIGSITGGEFTGNIGLLTYKNITSVTGGTFTGPSVGMQVEKGVTVTGISGGTFKSSRGYAIHNVGTINSISNATIVSAGDYAFWNNGDNSSGATIGEIASGTTIVSPKRTGIINSGMISTISGGNILGARFGIENSGAAAKIPLITGGVFYGGQSFAISFANASSVELGLTTEFKGNARYWGGGGTVFDTTQETDLVTYPAGYHMSTNTEAVSGITDQTIEGLNLTGVNFKYLTYDVALSYDANGGTGTAIEAETVEVGSEVTVADNTFTNAGYAFNGWNTAPDGSGTEYAEGDVFELEEDMILYAQWVEGYTVVYDGNGNDGGTVPTDSKVYKLNDTVVIPAGTPTKTGSSFQCWQLNAALQPGGSFVLDENIRLLADANRVITLKAQWTANTPASDPVAPDAPRTGDNSDIWLYSILMLAVFGGIAGIAVYRNKKFF